MAKSDKDDITMMEISRFREKVTVGTPVYIPIVVDDPASNKKKVANSWKRTTITKKLPFIAATGIGTYRWVDLYRWGKEHKIKYGY